ncbi:hypothetical protein [Actinoplanes sp. NPDC020271]|uniref:hypothetical protein n=1 Tax=Actinoplanes sp. NPDC020271 TaxID=3363896 RepID=UPI0037BC0A43
MKNAKFCLISDRPLGEGGLSWADLGSWWMDAQAPSGKSEQDAAKQLYRRLARSLDAGREPSSEPGPERQMFRAYAELFAEYGFSPPALIPQVYLHYDPYTRGRRANAVWPLPRQRMDYLMLLRGRRRMVVEMMREDRALRLDGYGCEPFLRERCRDQPRIGHMFDTISAWVSSMPFGTASGSCGIRTPSRSECWTS